MLDLGPVGVSKSPLSTRGCELPVSACKDRGVGGRSYPVLLPRVLRPPALGGNPSRSSSSSPPPSAGVGCRLKLGSLGGQCLQVSGSRPEGESIQSPGPIFGPSWAASEVGRGRRQASRSLPKIRLIS